MSGERISDPKKIAAVKKSIIVLRYQVSVFRNELKKQTAMRDDRLPRYREQMAAIPYKTHDEVTRAWHKKEITNAERMRYYRIIGYCTKDWGFDERIEWLQNQMDAYQAALDRAEEWAKKNIGMTAKHRALMYKAARKYARKHRVPPEQRKYGKAAKRARKKKDE